MILYLQFTKGKNSASFPWGFFTISIGTLKASNIIMFAFFYIEFQYNKFNPSTQKNFMQNADKYLSKLPLCEGRRCTCTASVWLFETWEIEGLYWIVCLRLEAWGLSFENLLQLSFEFEGVGKIEEEEKGWKELPLPVAARTRRSVGAEDWRVPNFQLNDWCSG